jgi:hypothetical protein
MVDKKTALEMARERGDDNMIMTLLKAGCDQSLSCDNGNDLDDLLEAFPSLFRDHENCPGIFTCEETRGTESINRLDSLMTLEYNSNSFKLKTPSVINLSTSRTLKSTSRSMDKVEGLT